MGLSDKEQTPSVLWDCHSCQSIEQYSKVITYDGQSQFSTMQAERRHQKRLVGGQKRRGGRFRKAAEDDRRRLGGTTSQSQDINVITVTRSLV